jgi:Tfp pilus assembly protein PilV
MSKSVINNQGISLIEAAIAITVLLVGIVAAAQIFPLAVKVNKTAEQTTVAADLAQSKIEEVFSQGFENIPLGTIEPRQRLANSSTNPFYYYERQTVVDYVDSDLNYSAATTGLKRISTTIYWRNAVSKTEKNTNVIIIISQK